MPEHDGNKCANIASKVSNDTCDDTCAIDGFVEWRPVHGWTAYEVSNCGQVRRVKSGPRTRPGRLLKLSPTRYGYLRVALYGGGRKQCCHVHSLVARAFIGECPPDMTVDHLDGDKLNNHATNLEYVTRSENVRRAHASGAYARGECRTGAKLDARKVREIRGLFPTHTNSQIARLYGVSHAAIRHIRIGRTWTHV
jgi:hypothetical protein